MKSSRKRSRWRFNEAGPQGAGKPESVQMHAEGMMLLQ